MSVRATASLATRGQCMPRTSGARPVAFARSVISMLIFVPSANDVRQKGFCA